MTLGDGARTVLREQPPARARRRGIDRSGRVRKFAAVVLVGGLTAIVALAAGQFLGWFADTETVTLQAPRAGLVMSPDAKVKLRGVTVGRVGTITTTGEHAELTLDIDADKIDQIPANVTADIKSNTIFGAKSVNLVVPATGGRGSLSPGATIGAEHVVVELNTVYQQLVNVLAMVEPDKLNITMSAIDGALSGRGEKVGESLEKLTRIVGQTNKHLPQLNSMLRQAAGATNLYADVSGDLLRSVDNFTQVGDLLVDNTPNVDQLLVSVTGMSNTINGVLAPSKNTLIQTLSDLSPTTALLGRQAPGLRCFIVTASNAVDIAQPLLGGRNGMLLLDAGLIPGQDPYRYPQDLPEVRGDGPPTCEAGLTDPSSKEHIDFYVTDNASQPYQPRTTPKVQASKLFQLLFGGTARG